MSVSAWATASARPAGPALVDTKLSFFSKPAHWSSEILPVAYWSHAWRARCRKSSSLSSLVEEPMTRYSGMRPDMERWSNPGNSLRAARSPVAPKSTMTCGCSCAVAFASSLTPTSFSQVAGRNGRDASSPAMPLARRRLASVQFAHVGAHDLGNRLLGQLLEFAYPVGG